MTKRSLRASLVGIQESKRAFDRKGWTQNSLAEAVNLKTRQPIWRFFTGQPVDRHIFFAICAILDLDWREIALDSPADFPELRSRIASSAPKAVDTLVQQVRSAHHDTIQNQCGLVQLLDINRPIPLEDIYVDINILEDIPSQQSWDITHLSTRSSPENQIGLHAIEPQSIPGIQAIAAYSKVRVLGQFGSGKTTFLQSLAYQCDRGTFAPDHVPILITLREIAEESRHRGELSLFNTIHQSLLISGIRDSDVSATLLQAGRILLLLDGIDEVQHQDMTAVLKEIRKFSDKFYKNRFVIACRTTAQIPMLRGFTDVEVALFTPSQIASFAQKWFVIATKTTTQFAQARVAQLMQQLELPENWQLRQLIAIPLFLQLACWDFHGQARLLSQRAEFYKHGLDLLLGKWDAVKGVERDAANQDFLLPQKLRLLSQLATVTFEQGESFFEQRTITQYISDYLHNQSESTLEPEELQLASERLLHTIAAQHGILIERSRGVFSFLSPAFQEYLVARKIANHAHPEALTTALAALISHLIDPRWREVFLLTAMLLRSADLLIHFMKQQIDTLIAQDSELQDFLLEARQQSPIIPMVPQSGNQETSPNCLQNSSDWAEQVRQTITRDRDRAHLLPFTPQQQQILQHYYDANQLLVDCLTCHSAVTAATRQNIEAKLLLPRQH